MQKKKKESQAAPTGFKELVKFIQSARRNGLSINRTVLKLLLKFTGSSAVFYINPAVPGKNLSTSSSGRNTLTKKQIMNMSQPLQNKKIVFINTNKDISAGIRFNTDGKIPGEYFCFVWKSKPGGLNRAALTAGLELLQVILEQIKMEEILFERGKELSDKNDQLLEITSQVEAVNLQLKNRDRIRGMIYTSNQLIRHDMSIEEVLEIYTYHLANIKYRVLTFIYDRRNNRFEIKTVGDKKFNSLLGSTYDIEPGGLWEKVFQSKSGVLIEDIAPFVDTDWEFVNTLRSREFLLLPLISNNKITGAFYVDKDDMGIPFSYSEKADLELFSLQAAMQFSNIQQFKELSKFYETDPLTGVPNRRYLNMLIDDEIKSSKRYNRHFSLVMMDIDHFKKFNDTYGHPTGDLLLKKIASVLKFTIRENDTLTRFGGEEFLILSSKNGSKGAYLMAERLRKRIEKIPLSEVIQRGIKENKISDDVLLKYRNICLKDIIKRHKVLKYVDKEIKKLYRNFQYSKTPEWAEFDILQILHQQNLLDGEKLKKIDDDLKTYEHALTISCGVAEFPDDAKDRTSLVTAADKALYYAKKSGRNTTKLYAKIKD